MNISQSVGRGGRMLFALIVTALSLPVTAATIVVTSIGDTVAVDGSVTLREAITSINNGANVNADVVATGAYGTNDTIQFNIPGPGVRTIDVSVQALPLLNVPVIIDGYSQPLSSANTNGPAQGTNAVPLIELNLSAGSLGIGGGNSTVQGLIVNGISGGLILFNLGGNTIAGNFIGTNATGTAAGPHGVFPLIDIAILATSANNTIGGLVPAARNLISGTSIAASSNAGILVLSAGNVVQGNLIGTNAAGNAAVPNDIGINLGAGTATGNTIGGTSAAARNVISGNRLDGADMGPSGNVLQGNYVGTDVGGAFAIANGNFGVVVSGTNTTVGGTMAGAGNLISGNANLGIGITVGAANNVVQGNLVGTDAAGTAAIGGHSVAGIEVDASNNAIGGTVAGAGNVVAFNTGHGVHVGGGTGSAVEGNSIHSNGGFGIKLGPGLGPNINDPGDGDSGANNLQNYPVLTAAAIAGGNVTLAGMLNSTAGTAFRIEFFANVACASFTANHGEGRTFIGFTGVATDAGGNASFGPLPFAVPGGQAVFTATATDAQGNTSEFSQCFGGAALPTLAINNVSASEGNIGTKAFTFTVTLSPPSASTVTVNYATADGTAQAGSDYVATSGMLTFAPGVTTQPIDVLVNGDTVVEPDETFVVNLSLPTNATLAVAQATGTIVNDDAAPPPPPLPTLTINNVTAPEGNAGTKAFTFTVTLSAASASTVTVNYSTVDGTAQASSDYVATSGMLTFAPGVTTQNITVLVNGDTVVEPDETFLVNLSTPANATLGTAQGTGTIVNDDTAPPPPPPPPAPAEPIPALSAWSLALLSAALGIWAAAGVRRRSSVTTLVALCVFLEVLAARPASAAQRTFVASGGNDANACSLAAPCRGFARAIAQTDSNGEIIVLDSAGYGPVVVDKSVSIIAPQGVYAGITVFSGDGVVINGGGINVVLRGLSINGQGGNRGIWYSNGASLFVDRCTVTNLNGDGVAIGFGGDVVIADSVVRGNGGDGIRVTVNPRVLITRTHVEGNDFGIDFEPSLGASSLTLNDSSIVRNLEGIVVLAQDTPVSVTMGRTTVAENPSGGMVLFTTSAASTMELDMSESTISGNGFGVSVSANSGLGLFSSTLTGNLISGNAGVGLVVTSTGTLALIDRNTITHNDSGVVQQSGGVIETRSSNTARENVTDVSGGFFVVVGGT